MDLGEVAEVERQGYSRINDMTQRDAVCRDPSVGCEVPVDNQFCIQGQVSGIAIEKNGTGVDSGCGAVDVKIGGGAEASD